MCDICGKTPCDYRCPNAPDPAEIYTCAYCNQPITVGELYYCYEDKYYHGEDCFTNAAPTIAVEEKELVHEDITDSEEKVGVCAMCGDPVLKCEERWAGENVMYHYECFVDNAARLLHICPLIAEEIEY